MNALINSYYTKAIRLTPNGFSLYKQIKEGKIIVRHYKNTQNTPISTTASSFFEFDPVHIKPLDIIMATHIPMLIPDTLYDDSKAMEYLHLQYDLTRFGQHYSDQLARYRALYFLEQHEYSTLNNMVCLPRFVCDATLLYQFLENQNLSETLLLSMNDTFADLIVLHKHEPVLINRLTHLDNMDIFYYILNNIRQFELTNSTLYVQYFYNSNSKLNKLLTQHLTNVIFL